MSLLFGPVPSRRLGRSLGVDMVPYKTCSFNCVYCELGKTTCHTIQRQSFWEPDLVGYELEEQLPLLEGQVDYITLAGSGEPTLNLDLGMVILIIKEVTNIPIAILTNSSLLSDPKVRKELVSADLIVPSLDAVSQGVFEQINQPVPGIKAKDMVDGLVALRKEFSGQIWLEILFCLWINDHEHEVTLLRKAAEAISPDRIQLNTVIRPPALNGILPSPLERLQQIANTFGPLAEVVGKPHQKMDIARSRSCQKRVEELLKRRPCTLEDIALATGMGKDELPKILDNLRQAGQLEVRTHQEQIYYYINVG